SEAFRNRHDEHAVLPAGQEMRRLAQVRTAGLDPVVRSDGNVQRLRRIAIEVSDQKAAGPVGIVEPPFERAGDSGSELFRRLAMQLLGRYQRATNKCEGGTQPADGRAVHSLVSVLGDLDLRLARLDPRLVLVIWGI